MKRSFWKSPEEKPCFMFIADGQLLACLEDNATTRKVKKRLENLVGVSVLPASPEALIKFNAKTSIPKRILKNMDEIFLQTS
jgi:hypothetical protein